MLLHSIGESSFALLFLEEFDALFETPVVCKTSDSCVTMKDGSLLVVGVDFVLVGFVHQHEIQRVVFMGINKRIQFCKDI